MAWSHYTLFVSPTLPIEEKMTKSSKSWTILDDRERSGMQLFISCCHHSLNSGTFLYFQLLVVENYELNIPPEEPNYILFRIILWHTREQNIKVIQRQVIQGQTND